MKNKGKYSDSLTNYQLFFEEIGNKAAARNQRTLKQIDYERAPSLSESQIRQLTEDLKKLSAEKKNS